MSYCRMCGKREFETVDVLPGGYYRRGAEWFDYKSQLVQGEPAEIYDALGCGLERSIQVNLAPMRTIRNVLRWLCDRCINVFDLQSEGLSHADANKAYTQKELDAINAVDNWLKGVVSDSPEELRGMVQARKDGAEW